MALERSENAAVTELSLYPNWSGLDLEHRNLLDPILRSLSLRSSEFTFTNLFIWRKHYGFTICRMGETILVRAEPGEEPPFLMPPLGPSLKPEELRREGLIPGRPVFVIGIWVSP